MGEEKEALKISMKKPKIANWLKLIASIPIIVLLIWVTYLLFYKTYPEIPVPPFDYTVLNGNSSYLITTSLDELYPITIQTNLSYGNSGVAQFMTSYPAIGGDVAMTQSDNISTENKINELKAEKDRLNNEISALKFNKIALEGDVSQLIEQRDKLSKISHDMQSAIIKFVEKNRIRDMLASAFIGALVSVLLTFILSRPLIRSTVDGWLWENLANKVNNELKTPPSE